MRRKKLAALCLILFSFAAGTYACASAPWRADFEWDGFPVSIADLPANSKDDTLAQSRQVISREAATRDAWSRFFKDRAALRLQIESGLAAHGAFDGKNNLIYLRPGFSAENLRHEMAHALIARNNGDAPYWFHEGAAYFLESAGPAACGSNVVLPGWIRARLGKPEVARRLPWENANLSSREDAMDVASVSAAFFLFAWSLRESDQLLHSQFAGPHSAENAPEWALRHPGFAGEFRAFVKTAASTSIPGC